MNRNERTQDVAKNKLYEIKNRLWINIWMKYLAEYVWIPWQTIRYPRKRPSQKLNKIISNVDVEKFVDRYLKNVKDRKYEKNKY